MSTKAFFLDSTLANYGQEEFNYVQKFLIEQGVLNTEGADWEDWVDNGDLKVEQRGAGANISVDVLPGIAVINHTRSAVTFKVFAQLIGTQNVVIAANGGGTNRVDAIIMRVDRTAEPNALMNNIVTVERVAGSGASPLSDGDIQTALGDSDDFIRLANVTVEPAETTILNSDIADTRVRARSNDAVTTSPSVLWFRPLSADPDMANLGEGSMWYNTTTNRFKYYDGTQIIEVDETNLPTADEKAALGGSFGTPDVTNKYLTEDDATVAATANRVSRRNANGNVTVPQIALAVDEAMSKISIDEGFGYVLGEAFTGATTPQPAKVISDIIQPFTDTNSGMGTSSVTRRALKIIPRSNCTIASVVLAYQYNNASDNAITFTASIQTDSAGSPSGTPITNGTSGSLALSTVTVQTGGYANYTFGTPPALVAGTTYWVVMTLSSTTTSQLFIPTFSSNYASFSGKVYNGSWSNDNAPAIELVTATGDSKSLWRSDGNGAVQDNDFDFFVTNTASAGAAAVVQRGIISGFTSLDVGSDYYLSNTIGTITRNKNEGVFVGTAISATQILIPNNRLKASWAMPVGGAFLSNGSTFFSFPFLVLEDGYLTVDLTPGTAGSVAPVTINVSRTYANNSYPSTNRAYTQGMTNQVAPIPFTIPVKRGERVGITANATGAQKGVNTFMPV